MFSLLLALLVAAQQPAPSAPAPATGQPPPAVAAPVRRPTPAGSTLQIRVTDRSGAPAVGVAVSAEGPVRRDGVTDASGVALFRTMSAGTYRVRAEGEGFVIFEKEVVLRTVPVTTEMALSAAAPPPPAASGTRTGGSAARTGACRSDRPCGGTEDALHYGYGRAIAFGT